MSRGRLAVSDHRHMGLKLHKDRHVLLLHSRCIYSAVEEIGESDLPGVTQDDIHAGKIDDGASWEEGVIKPFTATNSYQCVRRTAGGTMLCFWALSAMKVTSDENIFASISVHGNTSNPCWLSILSRIYSFIQFNTTSSMCTFIIYMY